MSILISKPSVYFRRERCSSFYRRGRAVTFTHPHTDVFFSVRGVVVVSSKRSTNRLGRDSYGGAYPGCLHDDNTGSVLDHVLRRLEGEVGRWALIVDNNHIAVPGKGVYQYATGQLLAAPSR